MVQGTDISNVLVKPVSWNCNLACRYCFYSSKSSLYPGEYRHLMSDEVLKEFTAQFLTNCGNEVIFSWQGGEPLLAGLEFYENALRYQTLFKMAGQTVFNSIQTNGTLINDDWAKFFAKHKFLVGVSLDGPSNYHNKYRMDHKGLPSFKKVLKGIEYLQRYKVEFNVLCLLNNINIKHPKELFRFFFKKGFHYIQFIPCVETNPWTGRIEEFSITSEQYGDFLTVVFDEWIEKIPQVYIRDFEELLIYYVTGKTPSCIHSVECGDCIVVEYNGDVYPCDFFVENKWLLGNLIKKPINLLLNEKKYYDFKHMKQRNIIKCIDCPWINSCHGGCPKNWGITEYGKNYFCQSYKTFFENSKADYNRLKEIVEKRFS